jgi:hypothetical protein
LWAFSVLQGLPANYQKVQQLSIHTDRDVRSGVFSQRATIDLKKSVGDLHSPINRFGGNRAPDSLPISPELSSI